MMGEAALRTVDLVVGYQVRRRQCPLLSGLNVSAHAGELVCLLGPNGIGKSTLLRTISRLQPALGGRVEIAGSNIRNWNPIELARKVGVVLTERVAVGALSGRQIVELGRYPHVGWAGRLSLRDHKVVEWALDASGAAHLAGRDSNKLSDGERQRLMIARAMAQEPAILILDEPTAFLDVASRVEIMGLLRALAAEENLAIIISTHDLELALRMADTIWLVMRGGHFQSGVPEDMIIEGYVEKALGADNITFRPEERVFRPTTGMRGRAIIKGTGLPAALATAVLEREGYQIVDDEPTDLCIVMEPNKRWRATAGTRNHNGDTFAALAALARTTAR
jgi:iron complex transport system ATP-binding protein